MAIELTVNEQPRRVDVDPETPLLWVLRDDLGLSGTKYGCGISQCGSCTVHLEGLSGPEAEAVRKAWVALDVPQCGYCQSGQVMSAVALLRGKRRPEDADIDDAMAGNVCRCATYLRIRAAIRQAARSLEG